MISDDSLGRAALVQRLRASAERHIVHGATMTCLSCGEDAHRGSCQTRSLLLAAADALAAPVERTQGWQALSTLPPVGKLVLVARMTGPCIDRVSDGTRNNMGLIYTCNGEACHWATHWAPMPSWWPDGVPTEAALPAAPGDGTKERTDG